MKITGIVEAVSLKTKGIKILDVWYNPCDAVKDKITPELKGVSVTFEISDDKKRSFSSIDIGPVLATEQSQQPHAATDKDRRYSRGASLNTALKIIELCNSRETRPPQEILALAKSIAAEVEKYVRD